MLNDAVIAVATGPSFTGATGAIGPVGMFIWNNVSLTE